MNSGQDDQDLATRGARVPIPWLIGTKDNWALFIHSPIGAFDLSGTEGRFLSDGAHTPIDIFLVSGDTPAAIMRAYAHITGLPAMPPLWSFGYLQSHRTLGTPEEVLGEARRFRESRLPCVRAGAILPLGPVKQHVGENSSGATDLRIHPGADGRFQLYEDDGETFDYRRGRYRLTV